MNWDIDEFQNCISNALKKDSIVDLDLFVEKYSIKPIFSSINFLTYFFIEISKNNSINIAIHFFNDYERSGNLKFLFEYVGIILYNSLSFKHFNFAEYFLDRIEIYKDLYYEQLSFLLVSFSNDTLYLIYQNFCIKYVEILFNSFCDGKKFEFIINLRLEYNKFSFIIDIFKIDVKFISKHHLNILERIKKDYYSKKNYFEKNHIVYDFYYLDKTKDFYNNILDEIKKIGYCQDKKNIEYCFQLQLIYSLSLENLKLKNQLNKSKNVSTTSSSTNTTSSNSKTLLIDPIIR
jgi:hypothetical protein